LVSGGEIDTLLSESRRRFRRRRRANVPPQITDFFDAHAANPIRRIESVYLFCARRMAGVTTPRRLTPAPFAESITAMIFL